VIALPVRKFRTFGSQMTFGVQVRSASVLGGGGGHLLIEAGERRRRSAGRPVKPSRRMLLWLAVGRTKAYSPELPYRREQLFKSNVKLRRLSRH